MSTKITISRNLFNGTPVQSASFYDVTPNSPPYADSESSEPEFAEAHISEGVTRHYAVTVNIKPSKLMNRRRWDMYTHDKQRAMLTRLERNMRKGIEGLFLKCLHFEVCPRLRNIHYHAWYGTTLCDLDVIGRIRAYWDKHTGDSITTIIPWRIVVIKEIFDKRGWLEYITKDQRRK